MRLGLRLFFAFFLINGLAAFFVLRVFMVEVKPSVRKVTEDTLVDTAYLLAALARDDLASGALAGGTSRFAETVDAYARQPVKVWIWDARKNSLDLRVTVTDEHGRVLFDSRQTDTGADYSQWRDVYRTLRGEYGARTTREVAGDEASSVMYVSAPIVVQGKIAGVLTASKPASSVQRIIDSAERKMLRGGLLFLLLSAAVGLAVTFWLVRNVRRLRDYAQHVQAPALQGEASPAPPPMPRVPGELGDLAQAMDNMRLRLEGRDYIEDYVRALTHELKSPVAAIRGAGELLQDPLPDADREQFAQQVVQQSERLQNLVDQLLRLSRLEQRQHLQAQAHCDLRDCAQQAIAQLTPSAQQRGIRLALHGGASTGPWEHDLVVLALSNLLQNAIDFAPPGSTVEVTLNPNHVTVQDTGPGVPEALLARLGERFFTTPRPDGERSGTGLGLSIVRRIMQLHGGSMRVANGQPGLRVELEFGGDEALSN